MRTTITRTGLLTAMAVAVAIAVIFAAGAGLALADIDYDQERNDSVSLGNIADTDPTNRRETVDADDKVDYFHFWLSHQRTVKLRIRRLDYNADLYVEDHEGEVITSSEKTGDRREILNIVLAPTDSSEPYYVRVEAREDGRNDYEFRYLTGTPSNVSPSGLPTITGTVQEGETLSVDTSGISDGNGLTNAQYSYQWIRTDGGTDTEITGATNSTYLLTSDDQGKTVKVKVNFTDDAGYSATLTSAATGAVAGPSNVAPTGLPTITGAAFVGQTLTADTSGISDDNGLTGVQYTYQWIRNASSTDTNITGATSSTYVLTSDDRGKAVKVKVSFTDDDGYSETLTSAATGVLATLTYRQNADPPVSQPQQQSPDASVSEPSGQDLPSASSTTGWLVVGDSGATGNLGTTDTDAFKISLETGKRYRIDVLGNGPRDFASGGTYSGDLELMVGTLQSFVDTGLERLNGIGSATTTGTTTNVVNKGGGPDIGARSEFDATTSDIYLVKVISDGSSTSTGTYTVKASEITSEQVFGDFTSQWNSGRIRIDDTEAMTGTISDASDSDWFMASFEAGKCYSIQLKGYHSNQAHDGGTLTDPKLKVMKFYDYYEKRFYDPNTLAYVGIPASEQDVAYYDETFINPDNFELLNRADKICNMVTPADQPGSYKLVCNYYCDDNSGPGNNSLIKVRVSAGGEGDYVIGVEGQDSTGTYSVYVKEIDCS